MKDNGTETPAVTTGIDLGDRTSQLCVPGRRARQPQFLASKTTRAALLRGPRPYPAAVDAVQASASKQASNMPRGMWAVAAALAAHELRSEV